MASRRIIVTVQLSEAWPEFVAASLDLLVAALDADEVLVTDEIREAAERFQQVIEMRQGEI